MSNQNTREAQTPIGPFDRKFINIKGPIRKCILTSKKSFFSKQTQENFKSLNGVRASKIHPFNFAHDNEVYSISFIYYSKDPRAEPPDTLIKNISISYLPKEDEVIRQIGNILLNGIRVMGFQNTKEQTEKQKKVFLYAINDNCNNCEPEWNTFPILLTVKEKTLEFKVIFAIDCKPGNFNIKPTNKKPEPASPSGINLSLNPGGNVKTPGPENLLESNNQQNKPSTSSENNAIMSDFYVASTKMSENRSKFAAKHNMTFKSFTESKPSSKFKKKYLDPKENPKLEDKNYYIWLAHKFAQLSKRHLGNWKFVYDKGKSQTYMKYTMKVLYPYMQNKKIPQILTSEAVYYYTSYGLGFYKIYKYCQTGQKINPEAQITLEALLRTCRNRSNKPIEVFSLKDNTEQTSKFTSKDIVEINNETKATISNLLELFRDNIYKKTFSKVFCLDVVKLEANKLTTPRYSNISSYEKISLFSDKLSSKLIKQIFNIFDGLATKRYYIEEDDFNTYFRSQNNCLLFMYERKLTDIIKQFEDPEDYKLMKREWTNSWADFFLANKILEYKNIFYDKKHLKKKQNSNVFFGQKVSIRKIVYPLKVLLNIFQMNNSLQIANKHIAIIDNKSLPSREGQKGKDPVYYVIVEYLEQMTRIRNNDEITLKKIYFKIDLKNSDQRKSNYNIYNNALNTINRENETIYNKCILTLNIIGREHENIFKYIKKDFDNFCMIYFNLRNREYRTNLYNVFLYQYKNLTRPKIKIIPEFKSIRQDKTRYDDSIDFRDYENYPKFITEIYYAINIIIPKVFNKKNISNNLDSLSTVESQSFKDIKKIDKKDQVDEEENSDLTDADKRYLGISIFNPEDFR